MILAVISAVGIPLSLSQQIHDASVLAFWIVRDQPARAKHNRGRWHAVHTIETINYIIMCLFFVCYAYQFAYIPLAWLPARKRQTPKPDPDHTFAVLIAAHDEATVIGALVDSLCAQTYPAQQIGIFVTADRCSDRTAEIARAHGAVVFARSAGGRSAGDLGDGCCRAFLVRLC